MSRDSADGVVFFFSAISSVELRRTKTAREQTDVWSDDERREEFRVVYDGTVV
jgi:hypothetical protein